MSSDGTFTPVIVAKRQRRLNDVDTVVLSLYAKGLTTGEISAHFAEVYGASVSRDTVSRITDRVVEEMQAWTSRPLQRRRFPVVVANQCLKFVVRQCAITSNGVRSSRTMRGRQFSWWATWVTT